MAWETFVDKKGLAWSVNWEGVYRIIRARHRASMMLKHSKEVTESSFFDFGTGWPGPTIHRFETNWDKVNSETDKETKRIFQLYDSIAYRSMPTVLRNLERLRVLTLADNARYWRKSNQSFRKTMGSVEKCVSRANKVKGGLKVVRDVSATLVVVGAGLLSGGAAVAALGGGSFLKGAYKYQDKRSIGMAVLEASTTFVFGLIPIKTPVNLPGKDKTILVWVGAGLDSQVEFAKGVLEGKTTQEALIASVAKLTGPLAGKLIKSMPMDKLSKIGVPAKVLLRNGSSTAISGTKIAGKSAEGLANMWRDQSLVDKFSKRINKKTPKKIQPIVNAAVPERNFVRKVAIRSLCESIDGNISPYIPSGFARNLAVTDGARKNAPGLPPRPKKRQVINNPMYSPSLI